MYFRASVPGVRGPHFMYDFLKDTNKPMGFHTNIKIVKY